MASPKLKSGFEISQNHQKCPKINLVRKFAFLIAGQKLPKIGQNDGLYFMLFGQKGPQIN